jgi:hypothetical protein
MKKPMIVYYTPFTTVEKQALGHMLFPKPKPLHKEMKHNKVKGQSAWLLCNAFRETFSNTFVFEHPITVEADFKNDEVIGKNVDWIVYRPSSFENSISFDLDYGVIMFCEEDLEFIGLPPIFQKSNLPNYGFLASGGFNIGKWFRSVHPAYFLWEGVKTFKCEEGEPWMYFKFETDREIIFKPFYMNQTLFDIASTCGNHSKWYPLNSLQQRYDNFKNSRLRSKVLKEIKANLLEEDNQ